MLKSVPSNAFMIILRGSVRMFAFKPENSSAATTHLLFSYASKPSSHLLISLVVELVKLQSITRRIAWSPSAAEAVRFLVININCYTLKQSL